MLFNFRIFVEIKKTIPLTIASKTMKYLEINVSKEVKDLYNNKYKTLMKEIEEDTNKMISCLHGLKSLILSKCPYYTKVSMDSM